MKKQRRRRRQKHSPERNRLNYFDAWGLGMLLHHMDDLRGFCVKMCDHLGGRDDKVQEDFIQSNVFPILIQAQHHATEAHLQSTLDRVWDGGPFNKSSKVGMNWQELLNELTVLRQCIEADLEKRLFVFIPPKRIELRAELDKTWNNVLISIPDAQRDIDDGHHAYMCDLNTASVFHMMRVAEHGLRILAKKLQVKLKHRGLFVPIEFADWDKVITAIKNKIDAVRQTRVGPKRQAQLEKYSDAADHCVFMKDIWRNTVSHARKPYDATEALSLIERVRGFMQFVAKDFV
jgi:hypothetical protein